MKKSVKRFLSTILALTMLCSCMAVMNVSAFAADGEFTESYSFVDKYGSSDTTITANSTMYSGTNFSVVSASELSYKKSSGYVLWADSKMSSTSYTTAAGDEKIGTGLRGIVAVTPAKDGILTFKMDIENAKTAYLFKTDSDDSSNKTMVSTNSYTSVYDFTNSYGFKQLKYLLNIPVKAGETYYLTGNSTSPYIYSVTLSNCAVSMSYATGFTITSAVKDGTTTYTYAPNNTVVNYYVKGVSDDDRDSSSAWTITDSQGDTKTGDEVYSGFTVTDGIAFTVPTDGTEATEGSPTTATFKASDFGYDNIVGFEVELADDATSESIDAANYGTQFTWALTLLS